MAGLPATLSQFRDRAYWDRFFKQRGGDPFEWYGSFKDFREALGALGLLGSSPSAKGPQEGPLVLHVGCGNSSLPKELYDEGYAKRRTYIPTGSAITSAARAMLKLITRNTTHTYKHLFETIAFMLFSDFDSLSFQV